jgi:hypothetical protein
MGGPGENNGIGGSFEERWFNKSHLYFLSSLIKKLKNCTYSWENTDEEIRLKAILKGGMILKIKASHDTADLF